jgi:hypothetical protein
MQNKAMKAASLTVAGLLLAAAAQAAGEGGTSRAFRWVDDQGVVHYGDTVPPEYARNQTSELNPQGVEVRRYPAQLSPAEALTQEQKAQAEARQKQHDQFLLSTYLSSKDIEQLRDQRLALIEAQIVAAEGFLNSARERMTGLQKRMRNFKPYSSAPNARRLPDPLAEELVRTVQEERAQQAVMEQKKREMDELRARFQGDIDRYEYLVSQRTASPAR